MTLSVIIVSWNVKDDLRRCLRSLEHSRKRSEEIIVVDNHSQDGTPEMVRREFPRVKLIQNTMNEGFARAANQGVKEARGDIFYFLNPDAVVQEDTLEQLVNRFSKLPDAGIIGTSIVNQDGSIQHSVRAFPTFLSQILVLLKIHNFFPRLRVLELYYIWGFDYTREQCVDQVMGASCAVRREVFAQLHGFDEKFWIWFEEVDFCKRAAASGWKVVFAPAAKVVHGKGKSFARVHPVRREWWLIRSMAHYFRKHSSSLECFMLALFYPLALLLSLGTKTARKVIHKNSEL